MINYTCKKLGITQEELATQTGFAGSTIRKWSTQAEAPAYAKKFFNLLIEHQALKEKHAAIETAIRVLREV